MNITRNQVGSGTVTQSGKQSKPWFDPMLIDRLTTPPDKTLKPNSAVKWVVLTLAPISPAGTGRLSFLKLFDMSAGYRAISLDYSTGDGAKTFVYDMITFGPMIRFGFGF